MRSPEPRVATLVLCTPDGDLLGALPSFETNLPWWQDSTDLVRGAREQHGVDVIILRMLDASRPAAPGGAVTYLAEVSDGAAPDLDLHPWTGALDDHRLRLPYARPGGPDRDLAWAI